MARAVRLKEAMYEVDVVQTDGSRAVAIKCFIEMDVYNVGAATTKINETKLTYEPIPFHVSLGKNEREFGIHPRYIVGELKIPAGTDAACYGSQPKRFVMIPVLTLVQFDKFKVYDKKKGGAQANTTINVNHSFDGKTGSAYTIVRKIDQVLI